MQYVLLPCSLSSTFYKPVQILFDMDGTLVASTPGVMRAWRTFGKDYGFDAETAIESTHGVRLWDSLKLWCNLKDDAKIKAEADRFEEEVLKGGVVALPGAIDLLNQIRAGSTSTNPGWTIVTSATNVYAPQALSQAGIQVSPFTPVTTANDVTHGKPHPAPFLAGAKSLNVDPTKCLVVEDAVNGVISGKASGARTLASSTTTPREVLAASGPDWIVPDLTHVSVRWVEGKLEVTIRD
ncbi:phosphatase [Gautieria morchelliformis]|nr:phosphatase [Gautieria morchelliformis]